MSDNFEEDFRCNTQMDGFCVRKKQFAVFNEKAQLQFLK